jgi:hypothetical protein
MGDVWLSWELVGAIALAVAGAFGVFGLGWFLHRYFW